MRFGTYRSDVAGIARHSTTLFKFQERQVENREHAVLLLFILILEERGTRKHTCTDATKQRGGICYLERTSIDRAEQ